MNGGCISAGASVQTLVPGASQTPRNKPEANQPNHRETSRACAVLRAGHRREIASLAPPRPTGSSSSVVEKRTFGVLSVRKVQGEVRAVYGLGSRERSF
jgi:hypothetical protein